MLEYIRLKNFSLVEDLDLELSPGLNVFTGETGAGKSLIVTAINALLGGEWGQKEIRAGKEKAWIEGLFVDEEQDLIIRREFLPKRSRFFLNDQMVSLAKLETVSKDLLLLATQHAQQKLLKPGFATTLIDSLVKKEILEEKQKLLTALDEIRKEKQKILEQKQQLEQKRDYLEYQKKEIEQVNPKPKEEEELLEKVERFRREKHLQEKIEILLTLINDEVFNKYLRDFIGSLEDIATLEEIDLDIDKAKDFFYFLEEVERKLKKIELIPASEIDKIEARLYEISTLKRKFKCSIEEILDIKEEIEKNISFLEESNLLLKDLDKKEERIKQELENVLNKLNKERKEISLRIKEILEKDLKELGFPKEMNLHFLEEDYFWFKEILEKRFKLFWQPNPGQKPKPLSEIASGGELSRLLLAIMAFKADKKGTLIFDEVDTGIGGLTLTKVGEKLKKLAESRQVILITHWPNLAVLADKHFKVEKLITSTSTTISCKELKQEEEIKAELSRMAGGGKEGENLAQNLWQNRKK